MNALSVRAAGTHGYDLAFLPGAHNAKRALEIAAVGCHSLLLIGPRGAGKAYLAQALPGLLPALEPDQAAELAVLPQTPAEVRPFRAPHSGAATFGLCGTSRSPGELGLARYGVLYLQDLVDFDPTGLRDLDLRRKSLPTHHLPNIVATVRPCPCGGLGRLDRACSCSDRTLSSYRRAVRRRLDLLPFDLHVEAPLPSIFDSLRTTGETSAEISRRVSRAWTARAALRRHEPVPDIDDPYALDSAGEDLARRALALYGSAVDLPRLVQVARSIADLAGRDWIAPVHLAEAIQYRRLEAFD